MESGAPRPVGRGSQMACCAATILSKYLRQSRRLSRLRAHKRGRIATVKSKRNRNSKSRVA